MERFLSAYEMGIDTGSTVAMRRFDELTNPERFPERPPGPRLGRGGGLQMPISEIWPWARITPWVAEAILERKR